MTRSHLIAAVAVLALLAAPAVAQPRPDPAQRPEPAPTATPPEKIAPPADARESSGGSGTEALGDRLSRTDGVIKPPSDIDPGMTMPAPEQGARSMPVIPPPGTHPADPVKPK